MSILKLIAGILIALCGLRQFMINAVELEALHDASKHDEFNGGIKCQPETGAAIDSFKGHYANESNDPNGNPLDLVEDQALTEQKNTYSPHPSEVFKQLDLEYKMQKSGEQPYTNQSERNANAYRNTIKYAVTKQLQEARNRATMLNKLGKAVPAQLKNENRKDTMDGERNTHEQEVLERARIIAADRAFDNLKKIQHERFLQTESEDKPQGNLDRLVEAMSLYRKKPQENPILAQKNAKSKVTSNTEIPNTISIEILEEQSPSTQGPICLSDSEFKATTNIPATSCEYLPSETPAPCDQDEIESDESDDYEDYEDCDDDNDDDDMESAMQAIQGMKQHALLILKYLNGIEANLLTSTPDDCYDDNDTDKAEEGAGNQTKVNERLDKPKNKGLFFGYRSPKSDKMDVDEIEAKDEERKLELKVREEMEKIYERNVEAERNYRSHYVAAPPAAARLAPNMLIKDQSKLKTINVVLKKPSELDRFNATAIKSPADQNLERQLPTYAIRNHQIASNEIGPKELHQHGRQGKLRRRKKKKKQKQQLSETT